jgi:hypothetical protein
MKRMLAPALALISLLGTNFVAAADAPAAKEAAPAKDQAALEKAFADLLTGASLVGSYTMGKDATPKEDRYTIIRAVKGEGDEWTITAKVEYKGLSLPIDIKVPVKWAGDTPVISVTDQKIPGFGTFTARVMFFNGQYAGTWSGAGAGHAGQLWGRVEKNAAGDKPAAK